MPATPAATGRDTLTAKQRAFVDEYLVDLNATAAARRAGYSERTARVSGIDNLSKPAVAAALQAAMQERKQRVQVDQDYVVTGLVEIIERCKQAKPVTNSAGKPVMVETPDGDLAPAYVFDAPNVLRGLDLLGRHLGMFGVKEATESRDNLAEALRTHARALPVATARALPAQRDDIEDAQIIDGEIQP